MTHIIPSAIDVSERKKAEDSLLLLAAEVDHRAKNMLAIVQAMLNLARGDDVPTFRAALQGRIAALARAHTLLADSRWEGADLGRLVHEELAPYGPGRVEIDGPPARMTPPAAQAIAMALHELATNAAKHGALSTPEGRVSVVWRPAHEGGLVLTWSETGGPRPQPPKRRGFGSTVIARAVEGQLDGALALSWRDEGLLCRMTIPPDSFGPPPPAEAAAEA